MRLEIKSIFLGLLLMSFIYGTASAGALTGRIIKEDGSPLAGARILIEGQEITTNEFGGYKVDLQDGERELSIKIDGSSFTSEKIKIYSPTVKQNWKVDSKSKKLIKIR